MTLVPAHLGPVNVLEARPMHNRMPDVAVNGPTPWFIQIPSFGLDPVIASPHMPILRHNILMLRNITMKNINTIPLAAAIFLGMLAG